MGNTRRSLGSRSSPRRLRAGHRLATIERLEERHALAAADLLPTLADVRAQVYQVVDKPLIAFDTR